MTAALYIVLFLNAFNFCAGLYFCITLGCVSCAKTARICLLLKENGADNAVSETFHVLF